MTGPPPHPLLLVETPAYPDPPDDDGHPSRDLLWACVLGTLFWLVVCAALVWLWTS